MDPRRIGISIRDHPATLYFVLTFTISWGGLLLAVGGWGGLRSTEAQMEARLATALLATFAGPPVAGLFMTGLINGKGGLRDLGARLLRWRVGPGWYAAALLGAPILVTLILMVLSLGSWGYLPGILVESDRVTLLLFGIGWGLLGGGLLEELGWTGFAVPALRDRYGTVTTGLAVGMLWGAWHLPITFWVMSATSPEPLSLAAFAAVFVFFHFGALPAFRVLLVWVHDRTASLLVVMLMHASYSASRIILNPLGIGGTALVIYDAASAVAIWMVMLAVVVRPRVRFPLKSIREPSA